VLGSTDSKVTPEKFFIVFQYLTVSGMNDTSCRSKKWHAPS
jgi:hypothetical protein